MLLVVIIVRLSSVDLPRPIVVRVDEVARTEALAYETVEAQADPLDLPTKYFFHRFLDDYYSPRAATVETAWPHALRFLTTGLANEAFRVEGEPVAMLAAGSARARRSSLARSPVSEPAYGLSGRGRWSAESRCQNTGDGVRFRVSHW